MNTESVRIMTAAGVGVIGATVASQLIPGTSVQARVAGLLIAGSFALVAYYASARLVS